MRVSSGDGLGGGATSTASATASATAAAASRDAEALFRSKPISEIRTVESTTRTQIQSKMEELRQLVGTRYRDLIDSADSIVLMKRSSHSISLNISSVHASIDSLSSSASTPDPPDPSRHDPTRHRIYGIACRVKYLVDTPENIWGCLDESMFLESAARYSRASHVHSTLTLPGHVRFLSNFPLLQHQWQIVDSFKSQISQRARDRLFDRELQLPISSYADALAAVALIDDLRPEHVLSLFLETRKSWVSQILNACGVDAQCSDVVSVLCEALRVIQVTVGQVGELFLRVLNDMPLFYKVVLGSPPASQLFGGIPNPDEEVKLWNSFREKLEAAMGMLEKDYIAKACRSWLKDCGGQMVDKINGRFLIDAIGSGHELASAEKLIRETMNSKEVLEGSLEWLKNVFGSNIDLPWSRMSELVLGDDSDLWDSIFEPAFVGRMKVIVDRRFEELTRAVNVKEGEPIDFLGAGGGIWFVEAKSNHGKKGTSALPCEENCLNFYFGPQASGIRDAVDSSCQGVLDDLLCFLESPKAALRLKDLAPYLQDKCYQTISVLLMQLNSELGNLESGKDKQGLVTVERALFIGRLLFALQNHSKHIPIILGPPRSWANATGSAVFDKLPYMLRQSRAPTDSPVLDSPLGSKRHTSSATAALLGASQSASPKLEELNVTMRDLRIRAHGLWMSWLSDELSVILSHDLEKDYALSSSSPLRGWEETVVKQEQSDDNQSDLRIWLPCMPSLYVTSFLFRVCEEVHRIGGHVLDKTILQKFASKLLEKVIDIYGDFLSTLEAGGTEVSEKGVLQVLLDLRFVVDVLSGGDSNVSEEPSINLKAKSPFRRKQEQSHVKSVIRERFDGLINRLSQRLDPIDWLTYEPYLWENERQSYLRHAVLFGFFVQLNRMYTDTVQKLPTNSESNIMRCSSVPRFKYLPISAPALSSRGTAKTSIPTSSDDISSRSTWKSYANGDLSSKLDLDDNSSFGVAVPIFKSFMQARNIFGESTLKLGSMLTDGQVGIFKDRSAAAMSTFGDILPAQAAGLLSSFTTSRSDS